MPRSLLPREHGAYVQLAAPLLASLVAFGVTLAAALLALGACLAFVANEPLLVVLGHRGKRANAEHGERARRRLAVLAGAALLAGGTGIALAPLSLVAASIVTVPALALVGFAWRRKERTLAGELVAAIVLTGAAAPVAVASGASLATAASAWAMWAIGYAFTVIAVHRVLARHRHPPSWIDALAVSAAVAIACALLMAELLVPLPLVVCSICVIVLAPSARRLRTIGFVLVGASVIASALLVRASAASTRGPNAESARTGA